MPQQAILCVDDEAIILLSIRQELKNHFKQRFIYETASNAEDAFKAMDQLAAQSIDLKLILSDWLMPGMKGDELLIAAKRRFPSVRTILVTGQADLRAIERVKKEAGTERIINKPWRREDLIEAVEACTASPQT
ncbi:MAG TPA: response regulator [Spirochaetales bacterium]|nr:response regulator [Spirochaetales bacterium]HRY56323.1 response regulator [Spirochaetia bacterium]HRZ66317.1 response regulator [Spirochaetia bacterium]